MFEFFIPLFLFQFSVKNIITRHLEVHARKIKSLRGILARYDPLQYRSPAVFTSRLHISIPLHLLMLLE